MLQIRLSKGASSSEVSGGTKEESVTVACPDHLVLADLPVAKSIGSVAATSRVKIVGRRSRRSLGERVHFCVRCDYPISIYGRLSPCEHAFCLDCARSDSICYLCDERIQKIQTIKMMEGIYICAAPLCLKSFLKRNVFEAHIHENHTHLLHPEEKRAPAVPSSNSAARTPAGPVISPGSNSQGAGPTRDSPSRTMTTPRPVRSDGADIQRGPSQVNFPGPAGWNPQFGHLDRFPEGMLPFYRAPYEMSGLESTPPEAVLPHASVLGFPPFASGPSGLPLDVGHGVHDAYMGPKPEAHRAGLFQGEYGLGNPVGVRDGKGILASQPLVLPPPPPTLPHPHLSQMVPGRFYHSNESNFGWRKE